MVYGFIRYLYINVVFTPYVCAYKNIMYGSGQPCVCVCISKHTYMPCMYVYTSKHTNIHDHICTAYPSTLVHTHTHLKAYARPAGNTNTSVRTHTHTHNTPRRPTPANLNSCNKKCRLLLQRLETGKEYFGPVGAWRIVDSHCV